MTTSMAIDAEIQSQLEEVYDQVMWLARRPGVTPSDARAWYSHIVSGKFQRRIRQFTGKASQAAIFSEESPLRLEHYMRLQTTLTELVRRHKTLKRSDPQEFVDTILKCERVHIVTFKENYAALRAKGNYRQAGIKLINWKLIPAQRRAELWTKMLRGRVANAASFAPKSNGVA